MMCYFAQVKKKLTPDIPNVHWDFFALLEITQHNFFLAWSYKCFSSDNMILTVWLIKLEQVFTFLFAF